MIISSLEESVGLDNGLEDEWDPSGSEKIILPRLKGWLWQKQKGRKVGKNFL